MSNNESRLHTCAHVPFVVGKNSCYLACIGTMQVHYSFQRIVDLQEKDNCTLSAPSLAQDSSLTSTSNNWPSKVRKDTEF